MRRRRQAGLTAIELVIGASVVSVVCLVGARAARTKAMTESRVQQAFVLQSLERAAGTVATDLKRASAPMFPLDSVQPANPSRSVNEIGWFALSGSVGTAYAYVSYRFEADPANPSRGRLIRLSHPSAPQPSGARRDVVLDGMIAPDQNAPLLVAAQSLPRTLQLTLRVRRSAHGDVVTKSRRVTVRG